MQVIAHGLAATRWELLARLGDEEALPAANDG